MNRLSGCPWNLWHVEQTFLTIISACCSSAAHNGVPLHIMSKTLPISLFQRPARTDLKAPDDTNMVYASFTSELMMTRQIMIFSVYPFCEGSAPHLVILIRAWRSRRIWSQPGHARLEHRRRGAARCFALLSMTILLSLPLSRSFLSNA